MDGLLCASVADDDTFALRKLAWLRVGSLDK